MIAATHAINIYIGSRSTAPPFLSYALDKSFQNHAPGPFNTKKEHQCLFSRRLGEPHRQSWPCGEEKINFTRFLNLRFPGLIMCDIRSSKCRLNKRKQMNSCHSYRGSFVCEAFLDVEILPGHCDRFPTTRVLVHSTCRMIHITLTHHFVCLSLSSRNAASDRTDSRLPI
jgi:hypothetical protein